MSKEMFNVLKDVKENELENLSGKCILDQVNVIAANAYKYPMEDVIIHPFVYGEYDEVMMKKIFDIMLDESKWIHIYLTEEKDFSDGYVEEHYRIRYKVWEYGEYDSEEYEKMTRDMGWPFEDEKPDVVGSSGDEILRSPSEIIGKVVSVKDIRRYGFEELVEEASSYISSLGRDGCVMIGGDVYDVIPVEIVGCPEFSCGPRDSYGELRYVVNNEFGVKDVSVRMTIECADNLDDLGRMVKCIANILGFWMEFHNEYEHEWKLLNISPHVSGDGRELSIKVSEPGVGVYGFVELYSRIRRYVGRKRIVKVRAYPIGEFVVFTVTLITSIPSDCSNFIDINNTK